MYAFALKFYPCIAGGSDNKESACNAGDPGFIPGSGRSPGEVNGYPWEKRIPWTEEREGGYSLWDPKELDTTEQLMLSLFIVITTQVFG